jgi:hypothetical protein
VFVKHAAEAYRKRYAVVLHDRFHRDVLALGT